MYFCLFGVALIQIPDAVQPIDSIQAVVPAVCVVDAPVKCERFGLLDEVEVKNALAGGIRKSRHSEVWACNAFDEWRVCNGYSVEKSIADLSEEADIREFVDLLFKFTLQVRKSDGSLYPPASYAYKPFLTVFFDIVCTCSPLVFLSCFVVFCCVWFGFVCFALVWF